MNHSITVVVAMVVVCGVVLLASGCASEQAPVPTAEALAAQRQADRMIHEARVETATLRAEIAAARIAAAKKEADLQKLQRQVSELTQVNAQLRQARAE